MRVTLTVPDKLMDEVRKISGEDSKSRAAMAAMESYVARNHTNKLLALRGRRQPHCN